MLRVPATDLGASLVSEVTVTRGEQIKKERCVQQAVECRDAFAKAAYGRLFSWIVNSINQLIQPPENSEPPIEIGILDIFGFENFHKNSFEQVCALKSWFLLQNHLNKFILSPHFVKKLNSQILSFLSSFSFASTSRMSSCRVTSISTYLIWS